MGVAGGIGDFYWLKIRKAKKEIETQNYNFLAGF